MNRRYRQPLLAWYDRRRRSLPWRDTDDPYAVLVSEIMLQQTQVSRVVPAYQRFLARFPTVQDLAAAPRAEVLIAWRGLGYNRRAANLHAAARRVTAEHGGRVPADLEALMALPGVGAYTARAVLAFAYSRPAAPVDTNVARVLSRAVAGGSLGRAAMQALADSLLPRERPGDWSQALMDLGAQICVSGTPRCDVCPWGDLCTWRGSGGAPDPATRAARGSRPQGRFVGSDRFHRGRIVDALRNGPLPMAALAGIVQLDGEPQRLATLLAALTDDGLIERRHGVCMLAGSADGGRGMHGAVASGAVGEMPRDAPAPDGRR